MIYSIIQALAFITTQPNMSEQEEKQQRIYDLLNTETTLEFHCLTYTNQRKKITGKELFKEKEEWIIGLVCFGSMAY